MADQKKNPYPNLNSAIILDYLEQLVLLVSKEKGLVAISEANGGYEDLQINDAMAYALTVPVDAVSASIFFEADPTTADQSCIIRFKENGTDPTGNSGQGFGHKDIFNPAGKSTLDMLRFIGIEAGKTHTIRVQYFTTTQVIEQL